MKNEINCKISLQDILSSRDERALYQKKLLQEYNSTLICFTLNIPGEIKLTENYIFSFNTGFKKIEAILNAKKIPILFMDKIIKKTGCEGFFVVSSDPLQIKGITCNIEDYSDFTRIFDIDVFSVSNQIISREELGLSPRKCFICNAPAKICARSKKHPLKDILDKINETIDEKFAENLCGHIGSIAMKSMLYEVSATPKPGLVDRNNCGSHKDMDFYTFMSSTAAISSYFEKIAFEGYINRKKFSDKKMFNKIRLLGMMAEKDMFHETNGINTHKGMIFSLGLVCYAAANQFDNLSVENILNFVSSLTKNICKEDFATIHEKQNLTKGEKVYLKYGIKGARFTAENGFLEIRNISYPLLSKLISENKYSINSMLVHTLISIMANIEDTNVISRHNIETANYVIEQARLALEKGGALTESGMEYIFKIDQDFINKNISPGGSADLLAVTYFIFLVCNSKE